MLKPNQPNSGNPLRESPTSGPDAGGLRRWVALAMEFYVPRVHEGINAYASIAGWWGGLSHLTLPLQLPRLAEKWDGILALPWISLDEELKACRCPVVEMFGVPLPGRPLRVCPDWEATGRLGAGHLLERGHTSLVFYRRSLTEEATQMQRGFEAAVREAGLIPVVFDRPAEQKEVEDMQSTRLTRLPWLKRRLADQPRPMAIMAEDDRFALDLVCACQSLGLRIPEEVAVLGADNNPQVVNLGPIPLSSVETNQFEVGYRAAEMLDALMAGKPPPQEPLVVAPMGVVVRESTDTYARGSTGTQAAYSFIRQNFSQKITPEQIAHHVGISSRTLQDHFKKETGRTLSHEITRLRLENACSLLKQTELKVSTVAHETGFASYAHFCSLFGRQFHVTPGEYRAAQQSAPRIPRGAAFGPEEH